MIPKLVTFDCAQTLVAVPDDWSLGKCVVQAARTIGMEVGDDQAMQYMRLYGSRFAEFLELNRARDLDWGKRYWRELGAEWMVAAGLDSSRIDELVTAADELLFGDNSILFSLFDDVVPCLDRLDAMGIKLAVVSNWDYSLHRVLRMFGIYDRFVSVKASLEEGVEKPDPRLFQIVLDEVGIDSADTFHVGDSYEDDVVGALAAGIRVARIDRGLVTNEVGVVRTLVDLPEAFAWNA